MNGGSLLNQHWLTEQGDGGMGSRLCRVPVNSNIGIGDYSIMKGGDSVKKVIVMIVCLLFVLTGLGLSFAEEQKAAPAEKKVAAPAQTAKEKPAEKKASVKPKQLSGTMAALDAKANTLTIKGKKGDVAFSTDDKTAVKINSEKKALADLKVGEKVTVKYTEADGKNTAKSITVKSAAAKASPK